MCVLIYEEENKMSRELRNREQRLRRRAKEKGLYIQKRRWRLYYTQYSYESQIGYCVGIEEYGLIVYGADSLGLNMPTLEEAEAFVAEY